MRVAVLGLFVAACFGLMAGPVAAQTAKAVDETAPTPGQNITYTITIDESVDQHNGRPIYSVSITDQLSAGFTFVSVTCSMTCTATTPAVGSEGTVTITGFGQASGPFDPTINGTVTLVVAASNTVGATFTNQACHRCLREPDDVRSAVLRLGARRHRDRCPDVDADRDEYRHADGNQYADRDEHADCDRHVDIHRYQHFDRRTDQHCRADLDEHSDSCDRDATTVPTATSEPDASLGDAASTDDVTDLPKTGAPGAESSAGLPSRVLDTADRFVDPDRTGRHGLESAQLDNAGRLEQGSATSVMRA